MEGVYFGKEAIENFFIVWTEHIVIEKSEQGIPGIRGLYFTLG